MSVYSDVCVFIFYFWPYSAILLAFPKRLLIFILKKEAVE